MFSKPLAVILGAALTGACHTAGQQNISPDPAFGETVKFNAAAQIIDPDPVYSETDSQPGDSGALGAAAVKRYRTGEVKDVEQITTTSGSTGSGPQ